MSIEQRKAKILINKAGGTAGADAKNYRVALPSTWINELGIDEESREVVLQFDGESIKIRRAVSSSYADFMDTARQKGHELLVQHFYDGEILCTKICADRTTCTLAIENHTADVLRTAFGVNQNPTWDDLQQFLESRCVPCQRDGLRYYLAELGLEKYDPLEIIRKTEGRMAEDNCRLVIVEG